MQIVVFGCGSQARYVIDNVVSHELPLPIALVDLEGTLQIGKVVNGVRVQWALDDALDKLDPSSHAIVVAHGNNSRKLAVAEELLGRGFRFASAIHRHAIVSPSATIEAGCIINAGAVVLPNASIEQHVVVHSGAVVEHDCLLGQGANVAPGASLAGRVQVGAAAYLYTGSIIAPGIRIGARAVVGAGAVVLHDVPDDACVVGNPARRLR